MNMSCKLIVIDIEGENMPDNNLKTYLELRKNIENAHTRSGITFKTNLQKALKQGFPIDYRPACISNTRDTTLLNYSIARSKPNITKILLDAGADVNTTDNKNWNALKYVAYYLMNVDIFQEIAEKTNDVNIASACTEFLFDGITALGTLCLRFCYAHGSKSLKHEIIKQIKILLDLGADPYLDDEWLTKDYYTDESRKSQKELKEYIDMYVLQKSEMVDKRHPLQYEYEI